MTEPENTTPNSDTDFVSDANSNTAAVDGSALEEGTASSGGCFFRDLFENVDDAVKRGTDKASRAAHWAAPKIKKVVAEGAYTGAYGVAFTAVFGALVARQILKDNIILDGVRDGIASARKAAEARAERKNQAPAATASEVGGSTGAADGFDGGAFAGDAPLPA